MGLLRYIDAITPYATDAKAPKEKHNLQILNCGLSPNH